MGQQENAVSPKLSVKKKLLFISIVIIITIILLELGFRCFFALKVGPNVFLYGAIPLQQQIAAKKKESKVNRHQDRTVEIHDNEFDSYSKYYPNEVRKDTDPATGEVFRVSINNKGFRGRDFDEKEKKKPGVIRIVTLGASSTFGFHNRDDETYPYFMEQFLNQQCPHGKSFEVFNLGIPHMTSQQIKALFFAEALPLEPDIVTFYEGINDSDIRKNKHLSETEHDGVRKRLKRISVVRKLFYFIRDRIIMVALLDNLFYTSVKRLTIDDVHNHIEARSKNFLDNLSIMNDACRENNIVFIVANQQMKSMLVKKENMRGLTYFDEIEMVHEKISREETLEKNQLFAIAMLIHNELMIQVEEWATTYHVPFVDIIDKLDQQRDILVSWVHLSPQGNQLVAQAFTDETLKHACRPQ